MATTNISGVIMFNDDGNNSKKKNNNNNNNSSSNINNNKHNYMFIRPFEIQRNNMVQKQQAVSSKV